MEPSDAALVPLALEEHRERNERHPVHAKPIDAAVTRAAGHGGADEAGFAEESLG